MRVAIKLKEWNILFFKKTTEAFQFLAESTDAMTRNCTKKKKGRYLKLNILCMLIVYVFVMVGWGWIVGSGNTPLLAARGAVLSII